MAREEAGAGVQGAYAILFAYIIAMVGEIGTDRALDILSKVVEKRGRADGKRLIRKLGVSSGGIEAGLVVYGAFLDEWGAMHNVVEKTEGGVLVRVERCPLYEAFHSAEINCDWMVEEICRRLTLPLSSAVIKQVNPSLRVGIRKFRVSNDDYCLEELSSGT